MNTLHRMDEDSVRRYREHDGEVSDEVDAARDYEGEHGRDFGPMSCRLAYVSVLLVACIGAAVMWWPR